MEDEEFTWLTDHVPSLEDLNKARSMICYGLDYDGGHHKQYYLYKAAKLLGVEIPDVVDKGMPA